LTAAENEAESANASVTISYTLMHMLALRQKEQKKEGGTHQVLAPAVADGVGQRGEDGLNARQGERARVERSECIAEERERRAAPGKYWVRMVRVCFDVGIGIEIEARTERRIQIETQIKAKKHSHERV
jgi:hypothetical protein